MAGKLLSIARRPQSRWPMERMADVNISVDAGLEGDSKGTKRDRQVTVLALEDWRTALNEVSSELILKWTVRRANLLVEGVELPRKGGRLSIGDVVLEVTGETKPCGRMDEVREGLRRALEPDWRGGVTCKVISGGGVQVGDEVSVSAVSH